VLSGKSSEEQYSRPFRSGCMIRHVAAQRGDSRHTLFYARSRCRLPHLERQYCFAEHPESSLTARAGLSRIISADKRAWHS